MSKEFYVQHSFPELGDIAPVESSKRRTATSPERKLREAIAPYVDPEKLREYATDQARLVEALRTGEIPEELTWILSLLATVLQPIEMDQIKKPADIAPHLMLRMGHLCQEQFCVACLNTKNRIQKIHTVYTGTVNSVDIRVGEVFREPIKLNSHGVVFSHNHPSGDITPSPEDITTTRDLVAAGKLLDCEVLDHVIVARDKWLSMRERGLGFEKA